MISDVDAGRGAHRSAQEMTTKDGGAAPTLQPPGGVTEKARSL